MNRQRLELDINSPQKHPECGALPSPFSPLFFQASRSEGARVTAVFWLAFAAMRALAIGAAVMRVSKGDFGRALLFLEGGIPIGKSGREPDKITVANEYP